MKQRMSLVLVALFTITFLGGFHAASPERADAAEFTTKIFRAGAIGVAVNAAAPGLNKFINTVTLQRRVPVGMSTKVVPILSVGEKGYIGGAQVAGPSTYVNQVKVVWQYEDNFSGNEFRIKALVPSGSYNPLTLKRVQKVGVSAIIDVSLDGRWGGETYSHSVRVGDVLKAGVVAIAVNAAADPLNRAINSITHGSSASTKVVPIATIGDKAYIGGAQVSGSGSAVRSVKAVFQYEDIFDRGKFRIKALIPSDSSNPLRIHRVGGVGITALIDTSIASQERVRERERAWRVYRPGYKGIEIILGDRFRGDIVGVQPRHDQGLHKGWYIGKGNQRKMLTGVWIDRYRALGPRDQEAFVIWWNAHYKDKPDVLEARWKEWSASRKQQGRDVRVAPPRSGDKSRDDNRGRDDDRGKGKRK